jgi:hypothetical protein
MLLTYHLTKITHFLINSCPCKMLYLSMYWTSLLKIPKILRDLWFPYVDNISSVQPSVHIHICFKLKTLCLITLSHIQIMYPPFLMWQPSHITTSLCFWSMVALCNIVSLSLISILSCKLCIWCSQSRFLLDIIESIWCIKSCSSDSQFEVSTPFGNLKYNVLLYCGK